MSNIYRAQAQVQAMLIIRKPRYKNKDVPRKHDATLPLAMKGHTSNRSVDVMQKPRSRSKLRWTAELSVITYV